MSKTYAGKRVVSILIQEFGFRLVSQKGSHVKLKKQTVEGIRITIVPLHRELAMGTLRSILSLAYVDFEDFLKKA